MLESQNDKNLKNSDPHSQEINPDWKKYNKVKKCKSDIKNKELIIELHTLYTKHNINFIHVKAHMPKPLNNNSKEYKIWYGNYMADKLAVKASCNN